MAAERGRSVDGGCERTRRVEPASRIHTVRLNLSGYLKRIAFEVIFSNLEMDHIGYIVLV